MTRDIFDAPAKMRTSSWWLEEEVDRISSRSAVTGVLHKVQPHNTVRTTNTCPLRSSQQARHRGFSTVSAMLSSGTRPARRRLPAVKHAPKCHTHGQRQAGHVGAARTHAHRHNTDLESTKRTEDSRTWSYTPSPRNSHRDYSSGAPFTASSIVAKASQKNPHDLPT